MSVHAFRTEVCFHIDQVQASLACIDILSWCGDYPRYVKRWCHQNIPPGLASITASSFNASSSSSSTRADVAIRSSNTSTTSTLGASHERRPKRTSSEFFDIPPTFPSKRPRTDPSTPSSGSTFKGKHLQRKPLSVLLIGDVDAPSSDEYPQMSLSSRKGEVSISVRRLKSWVSFMLSFLSHREPRLSHPLSM